MSEIPTPAMKWRQTWPDRADDFICLDGNGEAVARIFKHHDGRWNWYMNAWNLQSVNGCIAGHPREAAVAAELAFRQGRSSGYQPF